MKRVRFVILSLMIMLIGFLPLLLIHQCDDRAAVLVPMAFSQAFVIAFAVMFAYVLSQREEKS